MAPDERQTIDQLRAEIAFREKLSRQHVTGEVVLPDYYRKEEHDEILGQRMDATRRTMRRLRDRGVRIGPFLELGAERGQRSLVLANDLGVDGIAADISYHQLRTMEHFAELFGLDRLPLRVCCDANRLPFRGGSFPFVFAYQFLHHFPALAPVVAEIRRVMAGGHFWLAEEPYRRVLKLPLYRQRAKIYAESRLRRNRYLRLIESFLSEESCDETEHGVIENDDLPLSEWVEAMSSFDRWTARLLSIYDLTSTFRGRPGIRNMPNWLLGGLIEGLCRQAGPPAITEAAGIEAALACPDCELDGPAGMARPDLEPVTDGLHCSRCGFTFPRRDGVLFLLPQGELRALYPEIADA
jgi:SAM-dependent methyltransferase